MFKKKERSMTETTKTRFYQKKWFWIIIIVLIIVGVVGGSSSDDESTTSNNDTQQETEEKISYKKYSANQLLKDLDENALNAEKKYKDQYVAVSGKLANIDSSGDYISIENTDDEFYFIVNIQCYIQDDKQLDQVSKFKKGDKITVKGKITDVGEVMGYSIDIDDLSKTK